jgi:hypothetical protein
MISITISIKKYRTLKQIQSNASTNFSLNANNWLARQPDKQDVISTSGDFQEGLVIGFPLSVPIPSP